MCAATGTEELLQILDISENESQSELYSKTVDCEFQCAISSDNFREWFETHQQIMVNLPPYTPLPTHLRNCILLGVAP